MQETSGRKSFNLVKSHEQACSSDCTQSLYRLTNSYRDFLNPKYDRMTSKRTEKVLDSIRFDLIIDSKLNCLPIAGIDIGLRAATVDFWQARTPQWWSLHQFAATAAAIFYFSKSSQGTVILIVKKCPKNQILSENMSQASIYS